MTDKQLHTESAELQCTCLLSYIVSADLKGFPH